MQKRNFTYRISEIKEADLRRLAENHGKNTGKSVTIAEVLDMICDIGIPILERDIGSGFALARSAKTVDAKLRLLSTQFSRKVVEVVQASNQSAV